MAERPGTLGRRLRTAAWIGSRELRLIFRPYKDVECPICGNTRRFVVVNTEGGRHETLCLKCSSLERHRRAVLLLRRSTGLYTDELRVLHIAPEKSLRAEVQELPNLDYVTADLLDPDVDLKLDLTDTGLPPASFDVILCSHVLEHIPDDRAAMREMQRLLRPDGWALVNVPSDPQRSQTVEDPTIDDPAEQLRRFGQEDHVRVYAADDFQLRLEAAGFHVVRDPLDFSDEEIRRHFLSGDSGWDHAYFCTKSAPPEPPSTAAT